MTAYPSAFAVRARSSSRYSSRTGRRSSSYVIVCRANHEATSALDNITQRKVSKALDGMKCTRIIIAHRLSTIRRCSRILVLDGGRIAEDGTYAELIEKGGLFASLVESQRLDV